MKTTVHGDHLIQLTRFPVFFPINCYLVREGDGFTLLDTGIGGGAGAILAAARAAGGPIVRIALTHAHADHVGALDALYAELPDAEVAITPRAMPASCEASAVSTPASRTPSRAAPSRRAPPVPPASWHRATGSARWRSSPRRATPPGTLPSSIHGTAP